MDIQLKQLNNYKNKNPNLPVLEEIGNAITHGLGFVFAIVATVLMLVKVNSSIEFFSVLIYSFGLLILYIMSTLYHSFKNGTKIKFLFRRFDHLSIYFLIGGTFAPILLMTIGGKVGSAFFIIQWIVIAIGVIAKAFCHPSKFLPLHVTFYLLLGWSGLFFLNQLYTISSGLFWLIISGGIIYSLGIIPFSLKVKGAHFVWHFFVLGGTIVQFIGIFIFVL